MNPGRAYWGAAIMIPACLVILAQPLFVDGGVETLLSGQAGIAQRFWPIAAVSAVIVLPWLSARTIRIALHDRPAVFIASGQIHAFGLKRPVEVAEVDHLLLRHPSSLSLGLAMPFLIMQDSRRFRLAPDVMRDPVETMRKLSEVSGLRLTETPAGPDETPTAPLS
jgi:hypothetical protein